MSDNELPPFGWTEILRWRESLPEMIEKCRDYMHLDEWKQRIFGGAMLMAFQKTVEIAMTEHAELAAALEDAGRLAKALKLVRIVEHEECEDCWYSCPKSGNCCDDSLDETKCTCGKDHNNQIIDTALQQHEALKADP